MSQRKKAFKSRLPGAVPALKLPPSSETARQVWGVLEHCSDGIAVLDENFGIVFCNSRGLELLRCTRPDVSGLDFWDAAPAEIADAHQETTDQALMGSSQHRFFGHQKFEDRWVEYIFRRQSPGYVVNLREVGETQALQHQLDASKRYNRLIFEANPNAMWVFDLASHQIVAVNQAAIRFYGIERSQFMTLGMEALFPDGEGVEQFNLLGFGKEGHRAAARLSLCRQLKKNNQPVLVELAWNPIGWNGDQAILVSLADIGERHVVDSALRRDNADLLQSLALQQAELATVKTDALAFTQAVSVDLRDSLHVAHGFAARLADKYSAVLDESGRHYINRIQASIGQLGTLVDDLQALVHIPLCPVSFEQFDLAPLCRAHLAKLRKRDPGRNVTIEIKASLPLTGNKAAVLKAVACLLDNAWKFTCKKTEAWIKVGLAPGEIPGQLALQVSDNGAGFDAAYGGKLFTAFQRLHSSADFPGNGVGLAIVKRVAQLHGGKAWAESDAQAGASFFMTLVQPVAAGDLNELLINPQ